MATTATQPERERSPRKPSVLPYVLKWHLAGGMSHRMTLTDPGLDGNQTSKWKDTGIKEWREGKKTGGCPSCGRPREWALLVLQEGRLN